MLISILWRGIGCACVLILISGSPFARAAVFTVGNDNDCHYPQVQAAIDALPAGGSHEIRIKSGTYTAQAIKIESRALTLSGGYASCGATAANGLSRLDGTGGNLDSVITITGSSDIVLAGLVIENGDETPSSHGGGIDFDGVGTLLVKDTTISGNYAGYGGGINFNAPAGSTLYIDANTQIIHNTAQYSGGGVRITGGAELRMEGTGVMVAWNSALGTIPGAGESGGYGGGILVANGSEATITAGQFLEAPLIFDNSARYGGGIAVNADTNGASTLRMFSRQAGKPLRIGSNRASRTGGGIHLSGSSVADFARACLWDVSLIDNVAQNGAALYADSPGNSRPSVSINADTQYCGLRPQFSQPCGAGAGCGLVSGNRTRTADDQPVDGAIILMQNRSRFSAMALRLIENEGGSLYHAFSDGDTSHSFRACLAADNVVTGPLFRFEGDRDFIFEGCTVTGNAIPGGSSVISRTGSGRLWNSIVWQPARQVVNGGPVVSASAVIANESTSLYGIGNQVWVSTPLFADPVRGDYRPHPASPAVDVIDVPQFPTDVEGHWRSVDLPIVPNYHGPADIGAYELRDQLSLVRNGDFNGDLRYWVGPPAMSYTSNGNVSGDGASGVLRLSGPVAQGESIAAMQCVPLPGPGTYWLQAWARTTGAPILGADSALIGWSVIPDDPAHDCTGTQAGYDQVLAGLGGTWRQLEPQAVELDARNWSGRASLRLVLIAKDNAVTGGSQSVTAEFDGIRLTPAEPPSDDLIFANGFDFD